MSFRRILKNSGKGLTFVSIGASLHGYSLTLKSHLAERKILEVEKQNKLLESANKELLNEQIATEPQRTKVESVITHNSELNDSALHEAAKIKDIATDIANNNYNGEQLANKNKDLSHHLDNYEKVVETSNKYLTEVKDYLEKVRGSGSGSQTNNFLDDITNIYSSILQHISSMSMEQQGALFHISAAIGIFLCLLTIISIIYGDMLIKYFNLEEKYPKLAKIIQLRRKFQQYYLFINTLIIIVILILIISVNLFYLLIFKDLFKDYS
jgi:hypothetical protein